MRNIQLYIILLGLTLFSCIEDEGNYNYKDINKLTISEVNESYSAVMGEELTIEPVVEQTVPSDNLEYLWELKTSDGDKVLSTDKVFKMKLTEDILKYGKNVILLTVIDKTYDEDIVKSKMIELTVTSIMSYGYYFLTADNNNESILSYFSSKYVSKEDLYLPEAELVHTNHVEDAAGQKYFFGKNPQSISGFNYITGTNMYYSHLYILSEDSEYPSIQTDNVFFKLNSYQNNEAFLDPGYDFKPTSMLYTQGHEGDLSLPILFVSNKQLVMMHGLRLYRPAKHDKEYQWIGAYSLYSSNGLSSAFMHDELTNKIYYACPQSNNLAEGILGDSFTYDAIYEIKDSPSLEGKTILGSKDSHYITEEKIGEQSKPKHIYHYGVNLCMVSSAGLEFHKYYMPQHDDMVKYPPHVDVQDLKTIATDIFNERSKLIYADSDWYITSKNVIYTVMETSGEIKTYATLPEECGEITCIKESMKRKSYVIATYNANSTEEYKGSIVFIDKATKKQFVYKNVINKCVDLYSANANPAGDPAGDER